MDGVPCEYVEECARPYPIGYPPYGCLSDYYKNMRITAEFHRKEGCQWLINGEKCKKKWANAFIYYCEEHKDIPDIKRVIDDPLTTCRKRNKYYLNCVRIE